MTVALIVMLVIGWFCASYYSGIIASGVGWGCKIGLVLMIVCVVRNHFKSKKEYERKHAPEIQHYKERPPILPLRHNEDINTPQRRRELMKWNQSNPQYLVEGPCNETPAVQALRYSLLTLEQLATIPFWQRISIRNGYCHRSYFAGSYRCVICGKEKSRDQHWCSECSERYKRDLEDGWKPSPKDHIDKGYEWVLWRLQQIVAKDLQMGAISEETAKVELKEIVEVAKQDIVEMQKQDKERRANIQQQKQEQLELSDIVKRLS